MALAEQKNKPQGEADLLSREEAERMAKEVPQWNLKDKALEREFRFKNFREAMDFVNRLANVAEEQNHHPDICISYNKVRLEVSTHRIGGLSKNDFALAAKIDKLV